MPSIINTFVIASPTVILAKFKNAINFFADGWSDLSARASLIRSHLPTIVPWPLGSSFAPISYFSTIG